MADSVFVTGLQLAKCLLHAVGKEDRVIAETIFTAWRKHELAPYLAFKHDRPASRPRQRERTNKFGGAVVRAGCLQRLFHPRHRDREVPVRSRPASRINARRAIERGNNEAGIVGEGRKTGRIGSRARLEHRISRKARLCFFRFGKTELTSASHLESERREQFFDLPHLARIVGREDKRARMVHARARLCSSISSAMPLRAKPRSSPSAASENGAPSAVACTSTSPPEPVMTKFASVSAVESSS